MPEIKTSRIDDILPGKPWEGPDGTVYYSTLVLANGETGQIGAKSDDMYSIGQELTYTSEQTDRGDLKFKRYYAKPGYSQPPQSATVGSAFVGKAYKPNNASMCLSYSKDITVAMIPLFPAKLPAEWVATTLAMADRLNDWLKEKEVS